MRMLECSAHPGRPAPALAILLPGAMQQPEDMLAAGFADAVRRCALPLDLVFADPELPYVGAANDGSMLKKIAHELVMPARRKAYRTIWLGGISIGAFMALSYAASSLWQEADIGTEDEDRTAVDGLCLLSPYPGNRLLTGEILTAEGIESWSPGQVGNEDGERQAWRWLQARGASAATPIHLGYGRQDRFADGQQLMARTLHRGDAGSDHLDVIEGDHDWPTWLQLWENFLARLAVCQT
jgi:hypothetical protein